MGAMPPALETLKDEELVALLVEGRREAGDVLAKRHFRLVAKAVNDTTGDLQVVEDLIQEIFLKVFRKAHLYKPELGKFTSWLVTVSRNEALNHLRKKRRGPHVSLEESDPDGGFAPGESPSRQVSKKEVSGQLLERISRLPEPARTILKLRIMDGRSFDLIARQLKQPVDTVKTIYYRNAEAIRKAST